MPRWNTIADVLLALTGLFGLAAIATGHIDYATFFAAQSCLLILLKD